MKANRLIGAALAVGLGLAVISGTTVVDAQAKKKAPAAPAAPAAQPPTARKAIALPMRGLAWGMSHKQVAEAVDKHLDEIYRPVYQKTQPGVKMKELDGLLAEEKLAFRRSRIDFGKLPTGVDATPLKGEYTYLNKEAMMTFSREGTKRHFFFIQDKLWKIIDEHALSEGSPYGKDFPAATAKLGAVYGNVTGRVIPPDFDKGRFAAEVDWKDGTTHVRAIQRGDAAFAIAYEDLATLGNLETLRPNKPADEGAIDPAVAAAVRKNEPPPEPPPEKGAKPGKKK